MVAVDEGERNIRKPRINFPYALIEIKFLQTRKKKKKNSIVENLESLLEVSEI